MTKIFKKRSCAFAALLAVVICALLAYPINTKANAAYADEPNEIYYCESLAPNSTQIETINYATKSTSTYRINRSFPAYFNTNSSIANSCANVAGANVIGFYDRYYDNIIPNCTVGAVSGRYYNYYAMLNVQASVQSVINDLYVRMSTNNPNPGSTEAQYKNGLTSYFSSKGKTTSYNSVMTNSSFDLSKAITEFNNGRPICLYASGFNFTDVADSGNVATLTKSIFSGNHIIIAYGYQSVSYYNANGGLIATKVYLYAASGYDNCRGFYVLNNNGTLNNADAVQLS